MPGYGADCKEGPGIFAHLLTLLSLLIIILTLPVSLVWVVKVVQVSLIVDCLSEQSVTNDQEYERAVIFRLGRLIKGGARGPGVFFIIPCLDVYQKIDLRTATYDVPPQEVTRGI